MGEPHLPHTHAPECVCLLSQTLSPINIMKVEGNNPLVKAVDTGIHRLIFTVQEPNVSLGKLLSFSVFSCSPSKPIVIVPEQTFPGNVKGFLKNQVMRGQWLERWLRG